MSVLQASTTEFVASSTTFMLAAVKALYQATFSIITSFIPYVVGVVVLGILLGVAWSLLRRKV